MIIPLDDLLCTLLVLTIITYLIHRADRPSS